MSEANFYTMENLPKSDLSIKEVKNCVVTRSLLVMTAKGVDSSCLYENLPLSKRIQMNLVGAVSVFKNKLHRMKADQRYFFAFNPWSMGYYHWLTEVAVKFLLFRDEILTGKIVLPENSPRFVTDFLELFAFDNIEHIRENVFFKNLNVITNPRTNHYYREHLDILREQLFSKVIAGTANARRRIYVSRKHARARKVVNEDEVVESLKQFGFECVHLENASTEEQVNLFRNCECLISIHGAALTNAVFMPDGARVVELYPETAGKPSELTACFYRLCKVMDQEHQFLYCQRDDRSKSFDLHTDDIVVDVSGLLHSIASFAPAGKRW